MTLMEKHLLIKKSRMILRDRASWTRMIIRELQSNSLGQMIISEIISEKEILKLKFPL